MADCVSDTIGGFNAFVERQRLEGLGLRLTTVLFDDRYEVLHRGVPLLAVEPLTGREYFVRGSTALLDAVGRGIGETMMRIMTLPDDEKPRRVVVLIITDGMENASREFTSGQVWSMIADRKRAGWEFFYLGAGLEDLRDAERVGIGRNRSASFDKAQMVQTYSAMSDTIRSFMESGEVREDWDEAIGKRP